jgi:Zn-dependent metalloprotease
MLLNFELASWDNNDCPVRYYLHAYKNSARACFRRGNQFYYIHIGDGNRENTIVNPALNFDIIAHEMMHGYLEFSTMLDPVAAADYGAIQEHFCDIFALSIRNLSAGVTFPDWKFGAGVTPLHQCVRDLEFPENPNAVLHCNSALPRSDYNRSENSLYVNAGILGRAFVRTVELIGYDRILDLLDIWFRAITSPNLPPTATFYTFMNHILAECDDAEIIDALRNAFNETGLIASNPL